MARTRSSQKGEKRSKYVDYSSTDQEEDLDEYITSSSSPEEEVKEVKPKKAPSSRVPKKKLKKSTEERIKEAVGDSQTIDDEDGNEMVDEGESVAINTKRLLDARSKKAKRMDWEQGFFYLPKFDCYLPRHILHMILEYVPPFPYFLNIRSTSQQWLDDFDTVICQNVKELDLVQRNDIDYEPVRYKFPWYDPSCSTRRNNDCIRFLAILFPNIEKLIVPAIDANVRVPQNILRLFPKLETMQIFYVCPITLDVSYNPAEVPLTYRQDITNIQSITYNRYLTQFTSSLVMVRDENSTLVTLSNSVIPEKVINLFNYLVKEQHFSLKRLNILSLPETLYSKTMIDFILEENEKHVQRGYGRPELIPGSQSLYITNDEIAEYMIEKQFFKTLLSPQEIAAYDWDFISQILSSVTNVKVFKMLFEQSNLPLVFDGETNPLLWLVKSNSSPHLPEIIEFLFTLNPSLVTLGNEMGTIDGDVKNANILQLYITTCNNDYFIVEDVISTLIKIGCDTKYICPTTGNNLIHIHPCSPSLIDSMPIEFLQMKNNKKYNPFERLIKRIEIENNVKNEELYSTIDAFGKAYKKFNLPINEMRFENNQNLIHKFIKLSKPKVVHKLISYGVDANTVDDDGNLPLFYYIEKETRSADADLIALINSISDEILTKQFHNKSILTNIIERLHSEDQNSFHYFGSSSSNSLSTLDVIESLLSRGCNLNEALLELSSDYYEKGNLDLNTSLFVMQLLNAINSLSIETLRKIFKYFKNFEDILVKPCTVKGTQISPLLYLLTLWKKFRNQKQNEIYQTFFSDDPLISAHLLHNIIDIPNKKVDALFYSIVSSNSLINWQFLEGILGVKIDTNQTTWWYRPTNFVEIASYFESYRYEDEVFGNLNIVQLATVMGADQFLRQIEQAFSNANRQHVLDTLTNEPFKNGTSVLDELAKRGLFTIGNIFLNKARNQSNSVEWNINHFRSALDSNKYDFCYNVITREDWKHDFTNEEIVKIIIGSTIEGNRSLENKGGQLGIIQLLESFFGNLTPEERLKLCSKRFNIPIRKEKEESNYGFSHISNWQNVLEVCISEAKFAWSKTESTSQEPMEHNISLLDTCYWRGLIYLFAYIILEDRTGRKKKNILTQTKLSQDIMIEWLTSKCESSGKTVLHIACEDFETHYYGDNYPDKSDMINDVIKYLSSIDREDIINIQDNEGRSPLFHSVETGNLIEAFMKVSDLSIKNNKGETIKDLLNEEEKVEYARFFETKEKPKKKSESKRSTRKQKKDSSEDEFKEEKTPKKRAVRRKKKNDSDEDAQVDEDGSEEEEKPRKKRIVTRKRK